jgi:hypothetical protein
VLLTLHLLATQNTPGRTRVQQWVPVGEEAAEDEPGLLDPEDMVVGHGIAMPAAAAGIGPQEAAASYLERAGALLALPKEQGGMRPQQGHHGKRARRRHRQRLQRLARRLKNADKAAGSSSSSTTTTTSIKKGQPGLERCDASTTGGDVEGRPYAPQPNCNGPRCMHLHAEMLVPAFNHLVSATGPVV